MNAAVPRAMRSGGVHGNLILFSRMTLKYYDFSRESCGDVDGRPGLRRVRRSQLPDGPSKLTCPPHRARCAMSYRRLPRRRCPWSPLLTCIVTLKEASVLPPALSSRHESASPSRPRGGAWRSSPPGGRKGSCPTWRRSRTRQASRGHSRTGAGSRRKRSPMPSAIPGWPASTSLPVTCWTRRPWTSSRRMPWRPASPGPEAASPRLV